LWGFLKKKKKKRDVWSVTQRYKNGKRKGKKKESRYSKNACPVMTHDTIKERVSDTGNKKKRGYLENK